VHAEGLTAILLVDSSHVTVDLQPVVASHHERSFVVEPAYPRLGDAQPELAGGVQAEVFVDVVIGEPGDPGLEDVRGWTRTEH
jgi:hypothetical protein